MITKLPLILQFDDGVTPALWVLDIVTSFRTAGVPLIVICPAPEKDTWPVLVKPEAPKLIVFAEAPVKKIWPELVTVPAFVKLP